MRKNKYYKDFTFDELSIGHKMMYNEMQLLSNTHFIRTLFHSAWEDFRNNKFKYDGPTFVRSRFKSIWEVAAFIHDWRNSNGFVGYKTDAEFFKIMIHLNYPMNLLIQRWFLTRLTFINIIRHKIINMKNFYLNNVRIINDLFHIVIGFTIMYDLGTLTDFSEYTTEGKIVGVTGLSIILGTIFGFTWELYWLGKNKGDVDKKDVIRTAIGFLIGGLLSAWTEPSQTVWITATIISAIILVVGIRLRK